MRKYQSQVLQTLFSWSYVGSNRLMPSSFKRVLASSFKRLHTQSDVTIPVDPALAGSFGCCNFAEHCGCPDLRLASFLVLVWLICWSCYIHEFIGRRQRHIASESCFSHLEATFRISVVNSSTAEKGTPAELSNVSSRQLAFGYFSLSLLSQKQSLSSASLCSSWVAWLCRKHTEHCTRTTCQTMSHPSVCLSVYLPICPSVYLSSIYLSPYLSIHLSIHPSVYLFVCPSISKNGKLRDMCEDVWHVPTRDSQCRSGSQFP